MALRSEVGEEKEKRRWWVTKEGHAEAAQPTAMTGANRGQAKKIGQLPNHHADAYLKTLDDSGKGAGILISHHSR